MVEIMEAKPADDPTLQAMTICYREMQKRKKCVKFIYQGLLSPIHLFRVKLMNELDNSRCLFLWSAICTWWLTQASPYNINRNTKKYVVGIGTLICYRVFSWYNSGLKWCISWNRSNWRADYICLDPGQFYTLNIFVVWNATSSSLCLFPWCSLNNLESFVTFQNYSVSMFFFPTKHFKVSLKFSHFPWGC